MIRELRPYQSQGIDRLAHKAAQGKKRIIFQLATGGGKTVTFAGLVNRYMMKNNRKVLIIVHREELLRQAHRSLFDWYGISAAPVTAGTTYLPQVNVYVAMVETANNRLKKNPACFGNVGLVIIDECHIGNFKKLYDYFPDSLIIGFTATPISSSKKDPLKNHFEDIVCGIDIPDLINQRSLVNNKTYHITNVKASDLKVKNGEFDEKQMGTLFSSTKHVHNCIKAYEDYGSDKKAIVFNCNIEHSLKVNEAFRAKGYNSMHLDSTVEPAMRSKILEWFKETPNAILNNVGILTTGFDEPSVRTVIINRATLSLPLWLQMTGRGSRPYAGKEHFTIIDLGNNAITHGDWSVSRDWSDIFLNPDGPGGGGEAPSKPCKVCKIIIHASYKTCPHCGANNATTAKYDNEIIAVKLLTSKSPIEIDVSSLISEYAGKVKADGTPYKDAAVLHALKYKIVNHAKRVWRLKHLDEAAADEIVKIYQMHVKTWCKMKGKEFDSRYNSSTRSWMTAEFERVFEFKYQ